MNELEQKFAIPSVRKPPRADEIRQAIVDEVEKDVNCGNRPLYIKSKLKDKGIMIPRYLPISHSDKHHHSGHYKQRHHPHDLDPQGIGFSQWYPGAKKTNLVQGTLSAIGPFHEISADGHKKLSTQALQMGDIGVRGPLVRSYLRTLSYSIFISTLHLYSRRVSYFPHYSIPSP